MNLRKHAFITSHGLEYRECGEWKIEQFNPYLLPNSDAMLSVLWSANRAIWILCEPCAVEIQELLAAIPPTEFAVARNSIREIDAEENRIHVSGDGAEDRAMSERISFKPQGAPEGVRDCCILFPDKAENWGFSEEDNPEVIERALDSLQAEFGRSLVYPPGRLAVYLMEGSRERAKEQVDYKRKPSFLWQSKIVGPVDAEMRMQGAPFLELGDLDWKALRMFLPFSEAKAKYIHAFDKNAAFLQCVGIPLGIGNYTRKLRPHVTLDRPGLWRVRSRSYFGLSVGDDLKRKTIRDDFAPPGLRGSLPFSQWVTTPTLKLLCELDLIHDIEEAWLADDSHKLFSTYYSHIKNAIVSADHDTFISRNVEDVKRGRMMKRFIKQIYVKGIGYLHSEFFKDEWFCRPDWWATIVSEAAARIFRDAIEVKRECDAWPIATYIDCLYYVSDHPDPWESFPIFNGRFSSKFKHKGTCPLTPDLASAAERGLTPGEFGGLFKKAVQAYDEGEI